MARSIGGEDPALARAGCTLLLQSIVFIKITRLLLNTPPPGPRRPAPPESTSIRGAVSARQRACATISGRWASCICDCDCACACACNCSARARASVSDSLSARMQRQEREQQKLGACKTATARRRCTRQRREARLQRSLRLSHIGTGALRVCRVDPAWSHSPQTTQLQTRLTNT